jgi:hypothetical protein
VRSDDQKVLSTYTKLTNTKRVAPTSIKTSGTSYLFNIRANMGVPLATTLSHMRAIEDAGGQNGAITKLSMDPITAHTATALSAIVVTIRSVRRSVPIN